MPLFLRSLAGLMNMGVAIHDEGNFRLAQLSIPTRTIMDGLPYASVNSSYKHSFYK